MLTERIELPRDLDTAYTATRRCVDGRVALMGWFQPSVCPLAYFSSFDEARAAQIEMRERIEVTRKLLCPRIKVTATHSVHDTY